LHEFVAVAAAFEFSGFDAAGAIGDLATGDLSQQRATEGLAAAAVVRIRLYASSVVHDSRRTMAGDLQRTCAKFSDCLIARRSSSEFQRKPYHSAMSAREYGSASSSVVTTVQTWVRRPGAVTQ
jgi:hypothetical protein